MIATGPTIEREVQAGRITISPFRREQIEPNSYAFRLGPELLVPRHRELDAAQGVDCDRVEIPTDGLCLEPGRLYLGSTAETIGSTDYAATLYARRSTATAGIWIQFSAPLGHTGAIIPWTLEVMVTQPTIIYGGMLIGKIAFWLPRGDVLPYGGKYASSTGVTPSKLSLELWSRTSSR